MCASLTYERMQQPKYILVSGQAHKYPFYYFFKMPMYLYVSVGYFILKLQTSYQSLKMTRILYEKKVVRFVRSFAFESLAFSRVFFDF